MDDILSKIVLIIITAFLLFVVPSLYINLLIGQTREEYTSSQTKTLVDGVIYKGILTKEMYDYYIRSTGVDKNNFMITVKRPIPVIKKYIKNNDRDNDKNENLDNDIKNNIEWKDILYTECTINKYLDTEKKFSFELGDEVVISVDVSYYESANVFLEKIFGIKLKYKDIRYGGIVKNEVI